MGLGGVESRAQQTTLVQAAAVREREKKKGWENWLVVRLE